RDGGRGVGDNEVQVVLLKFAKEVLHPRLNDRDVAIPDGVSPCDQEVNDVLGDTVERSYLKDDSSGCRGPRAGAFLKLTAKAENLRGVFQNVFSERSDDKPLLLTGEQRVAQNGFKLFKLSAQR